jgi:hypothetical protein
VVRCAAVAGAVTAAVLLGACTTVVEGRAAPAAQAAGPVAGAVAEGRPPAGAGPPDLRFDAFSAAPCGVLTAAQREGLGSFLPPEEEPDVDGTTCKLSGEDVTVDPNYYITLTVGRTIETYRANPDLADFPVVTDTAVAGYPAVSWSATDGLVTCTTAVANAADQVFLTGVFLADGDPEYAGRACAAAENLAAEVLTTLRG